MHFQIYQSRAYIYYKAVIQYFQTYPKQWNVVKDSDTAYAKPRQESMEQEWKAFLLAGAKFTS
jgi:hypothetical protein